MNTCMPLAYLGNTHTHTHTLRTNAIMIFLYIFFLGHYQKAMLGTETPHYLCNLFYINFVTVQMLVTPVASLCASGTTEIFLDAAN